jgi:6-phosphogluconolactonase
MKFLHAAPLVCLISSSIFVNAQMPAPRFLFSSDFHGNKVRGYLVNSTTGALKANGQSSTHSGPNRVAADKGGFRLYVINQGSKNLDAYFINRTSGHLTPVPGSPFAIGKQPTDVYVHSSGKFVYAGRIGGYSVI